MQKILIVEDDFDIQELLQNFLQEAGYEIVVANDGIEALTLFPSNKFDLILLDIMLPKVDGFAVCELIRKQSSIPIIMLTALNGEEEQIKGLDLQVDDYITKPFSMPILIRKIAAVLRRMSCLPEDEHKIISYKNLTLDIDSYVAAINGNTYELTQREFEILHELLTHQGRIMTRQNLLDKLWRYDFYGDERVVDTHIKNRTDYWTYFDYDQLMGYSDYAALRAMLGYEPAAMSENEYIVHCMDHLKPALEGYNDKLVAGGIELTQGGMYNEVLTQFTWDGNGRGFILVVPDRAVDGQTASLDIWAMMTAQPVDGKVYQGIQDLRDERSNLSGDPDIYDTLMSKAGLKEEYASLSALVVFPLFYLALVLIMAAATILTIQFLSDAGKYRRQFQILYDLGMDKREIRGTLNRQFAIFYGMPVLPPMLICIVFMFALGQAFDAGIIISAAHLWGIIGFSLFLFFAIYLLYVAAASHSMKKAVLPD